MVKLSNVNKTVIVEEIGGDPVICRYSFSFLINFPEDSIQTRYETVELQRSPDHEFSDEELLKLSREAIAKARIRYNRDIEQAQLTTELGTRIQELLEIRENTEV